MFNNNLLRYLSSVYNYPQCMLHSNNGCPNKAINSALNNAFNLISKSQMDKSELEMEQYWK